MTPDRLTWQDMTLQDQRLSGRVQSLREAYFKAVPEICTERPLLVTRYSLEHGLLDRFGKGQRITSLHKAKLYRHVLAHRRPVVWQTQAVDRNMNAFSVTARSLFAGSTTSRFKGVPIFPEFLGLSLWPELLNIKTRSKNPYYLAEADLHILNEEVFPHWLDGSILEMCRARLRAERLASAGGDRDSVELKLLERMVFYLTSKGECISHTIPDFSKAVRLGLRAIIDEAQSRGGAAADAEQREFYAAMGQAMEGVITYSRNLAGEARRQAQATSDATEKAELLTLAEIHDRIPAQPARTFREGLSAIWTCWTAIHLENPDIGLSLGRLDQLLNDLYCQDIAAGRLTIAQAVELLCCLWLKIGDHVPMVPATGEELFGGAGSNQAITVGGVDTEGRDAVCELTYVMIRAIELLRLRDPNLNARYCSGVNSKAYLRRLCEVNLNIGATPAIHNDHAVIAALVAKGETLAQARDFGIIGCVEPGSNGRFYGATASILLNLTSVLELAMFDGQHRHTGLGTLISERTGEAASFVCFADFQKAFVRQLAWMIERATSLNNALGRIHQEAYPTPILSSLFEGPMEKGRDLIFGGAAINSSGATIIGFADVVDSLAAIERVVFEEGMPFADLLRALCANFDKFEPLRARLRNPQKTPKYGNEAPSADAIALWLASTLDSLFGRIENYRGGRYRVGYWTMTNHAGFGRLSRATPNGRCDGENFSSGITPVSGVTPALTKALRSVASLPSVLLANGVALNLKYTPDNAEREQMLDNFVASVEGYFDPATGGGVGGMEIQFNLTGHDTFVDAVKNPQKYPELLVRVSGYTAFFKDLNPQMQQEIIERTEYNLATGSAVDFSRNP